MTFASDLVAIVKEELKVAGVDFDDGGDPSYFADLHFELLQRRPPATPRRVHFSKELHTSLGLLQSESLEAWRSVFYVRGLLVQGKDVTSFLSRLFRVDGGNAVVSSDA